MTRTLQLLNGEGALVGEWEIGTQKTQVSYGPLPLEGSSASYTFRVEPAGRVDIDSVSVQPLADFSVSIRDY